MEQETQTYEMQENSGASAEDRPSADALGEKLGAMLADPESMKRLGAMASALASSGALSGLLGGASPDVPQNEEVSSSRPSEGGASELLGALPIRGIVGSGSRHKALLHALKPYLGPEKQARIDRMVKLLQLAELADGVLRGGGE